MQRRLYHFSPVFKAVLFFIISGLFLSLIAISSASKAVGQSISQGYETKDDMLRPGMAVQFATKDNPDNQFIERASSQSPERIIGVTTDASKSFAVIGSTKQQVYVQSSGQVVVYVSDVGGLVKKGDLLTISPLKGVFMKVGGQGSVEIAAALEDALETKSEDIPIDGGTTDKKTTKVSKVLVNLDRHTFRGSENTTNTLSRLSRALVGKDVGELRVLLSLVLFALLLIVEGGIVYGAISSSLTSLGRNPLAGKAIKRELIRVLAIAVVILLIGLAVVYTILWV